MFCWKPHHTADPYQAWSHTSAPLSLSLPDCLPQAVKESSVPKSQRIPSNRHCPGWPLLTEVHGGSTVQRHKLKAPQPRFSIEAKPAAPEGSCASLKGNKCPEISISSSARTKFARLRVKKAYELHAAVLNSAALSNSSSIHKGEGLTFLTLLISLVHYQPHSRAEVSNHKDQRKKRPF